VNAGESGTGYTTDGADAPEWDLHPDDDSGAVIEAVGRQVKLWREAAGLRQAEFGSAIGYSENLVYKVEAGKRIPQAEFLESADRVLDAGGKLLAMKKDVAEARYPKKVRDLAKLEGDAVEIGAYSNHNVHGLLQTEEHTRALFDMRRPSYSEGEVDRQVAGRLARQVIFERHPLPTLTFVQEEATLRRPIGGKEVHRRQLRRLLEVGQYRHVDIQVMPNDREVHAGMAGELRLLKLSDGSTVGYSEAQLTSRVITQPTEVQILELRYGIIRAQALTPRESLAFIEKVLGDT
jgi:transcriptional regulator with XRE-family HTH domain